MLERGVTLRLSLRVQRIGSLRAVIAALGRIVAGEKAIGEAIAVTDDPGGVGVLTHILLLDAVVLDGIVDHAADEGDVGARAQFGEYICNGAGAIETRIHVENIGAALLGAG